MQVLWDGLLPRMEKDHGFVDIGDVESLTGIKMQRVVDVDQHTTIGLFDAGPPSTLSIRIELDKDVGGNGVTSDSWQRSQGLATPGQSMHSTLNLSCMSYGSRPLILAKAEADLEALGYKSLATVGMSSHFEIFAKTSLMQQVYLYYDLPMESVPAVTSVRIIGVQLLRQASKESQK